MKWWHEKQWQQHQIYADQVREAVIQDVFTVRRSLELAMGDPQGFSLHLQQMCLSSMEKIHQDIEALGNALSPPYIETSFPLALQACVETWRSRKPNSSFTLQLPADLLETWRNQSPEQSRFILSVLNDLLEFALFKFTVEAPVTLQLSQQKHQGELKIQIAYPDFHTLKATLQAPELKYLGRIFQFLTTGSFFYQRRGLKVLWYVRWWLKKS